jgi:hypothetical protein
MLHLMQHAAVSIKYFLQVAFDFQFILFCHLLLPSFCSERVENIRLPPPEIGKKERSSDVRVCLIMILIASYTTKEYSVPVRLEEPSDTTNKRHP